LLCGAVGTLSLTASVKFPEENNRSTDPNYASVLLQPVDNLSPVYDGDGAIFAIARLPHDKRVNNLQMGLLGNDGGSGGNRIRLGLYGTTAGVSSYRNRLYTRFEGTSLTTPEVDEEAFLVVLYRSGDTKGIDWYSLETGEKHSGESSTGASPAYLNSIGPNFMVGGIGADAPSAVGGDSMWPGEIDCVGYVEGAVSEAQWGAVARGADAITTLGAANLKWFRDLSAPAASYLAPAGATADQTSAMTVWGAPLRPGSDFRRQSENEFLRIDGLSDGWLYGLTVGKTSRTIPVSGDGAGLSSAIEVRVLDAGDLSVVVDWQSMGTLDNGLWFGSIEVPKGGWYVVEARADGLAARRADAFGVGWKIIQLGQSQTSIYLGANTGLATLPPELHYSASYLTNDDDAMSMTRLGAVSFSDGLTYFIEQFRVFDATTPIMIMDAAINGTSQVNMVTEGQGRDWSIFQEKLDAYGNDISVVVKNWGTSDMSRNDYDAVLDTLVYGTGPLAADHSLEAALAPGWRFAVSPLTRHTRGGGAYDANANQTRESEVVWAHDHDHTVGPPVSDFTIEPAGGPHQNTTVLMANPVFGVRQAVAVAWSLELDDSTNPSFADEPLFRDGVLRVYVNLPNGGNLSSPSPNDLRSFEVNEGVGWTASGFTAAINGNAVELTRDTGVWPEGTEVRYLGNLQSRAEGDAAAETAIIGSALYETWPKDVLGFGLPLIGSITSGGDWSTLFAATAQDADAFHSQAYQAWAETEYQLSGSEAEPDADPDGDGIPNLAEFAFASSPIDRSALSATHTYASVLEDSGTRYLALTIAVRTGATFAGVPGPTATVDNVIYAVEGSDDLLAFDQPVVEVVPAASDELPALPTGWEYRTFRFSSGDSLQEFLRVQVEAETPAW
jgi:hypothetical protein